MVGETGQQSSVPTHVAIIMDGNRRWANGHALPVKAGHKQGYENMVKIFDYAISLGIRYLTFYAFSTENTKRNQEEVSEIMQLAHFVADKELPKYQQRNVCVRIIGRRSEMPADLLAKIEEVEQTTGNNTGGSINIAFFYGGRAEIVDSVNALIDADKEITEENITENLYTAGQPDPELIIRTGGSPRLSNFLMWQSAYSEIYLTDTLWPDFQPTELDTAIDFLYGVKRNFGK